MSPNPIPYPSDLGEWSRQKDGAFKERMSMTPGELKSVQTSVKRFTQSRFDRNKSARGQSDELFESIKTEVLKMHKTILNKYEDAWPVRVLTIAYAENRVAYEKRSQRLRLQRQQSQAIARAMDEARAEDRAIPIVQDCTSASRQSSTLEGLQDPPSATTGLPLSDARNLSERDELETIIVLQAAVLRPCVIYADTPPRMRPATGLFKTRPTDEINLLDASAELDVFTRLLSSSSALDPTSRLYELAITWAAKEDSVIALHALYTDRDAINTAINATLYSGTNALRIAVFFGAIKCVRWLLVKGADPCSVPYYGEMIPHCLCFYDQECNHMEVMLELLHHDIPCNHNDLRHASRAGSLESVKAILSRNIGTQHIPSLSLELNLHDFLCSGQAESAKFLIEYGATPSTSDLVQALSHDLLDVAIMIVERDPSLVRNMTFSQVCRVLESGRRRIADYLIQCGVPTNMFDLTLISKHGWLDYVEHILPTLAAYSEEVNDALCAALEYGHADIATLLLPSSICSYEHLRFASRSGLLAAVKLILARGIPVNTRDETVSALAYAYLGGHGDVIAFLSMSGATFASPDLVHAASSGQVDVVRCILRSGIEVDSCKTAALNQAIDRGFNDVADLLVHEIPLQSWRSERHSRLQSLLCNVVYRRRMDLALFINNNLQLELTSPHDLLVAASESGSESALEQIISWYPQVIDTERSHNETSALRAAIRNGHSSAARFLVEHGAAFTQEDLAVEISLVGKIIVSIIPTILASMVIADDHTWRDSTAVQDAFFYENITIAELLVRQGPNSWIDGPLDREAFPTGTLLQKAASEGWPGVVKALLDRGAQDSIDVDEREGCHDFSPPLQLALDNWHEHEGVDENEKAVIELLLKHGADVSRLERPEMLQRLLTHDLLSSLPPSTRQQIQALGYVPAEPTVTVLDGLVFDNRCLLDIFQPR